MKNRRRGALFTASVAGLLIATGLAIYASASIVYSITLRGYQIDYLGRSYDAMDNETTFTYVVTKVNPPAKDLSHIDFALPLCAGEIPVIVATSPSDQNIEVNTDPTTGIFGIKFDSGITTGPVTLSFTLSGNYGESLIDVAIKSGSAQSAPPGYSIGQIPGPACPSGSESFSISGTVFVDANQNGALNTDEPLLSDVTVSLLDAQGNEVAATLTDGNGHYQFDGLLPGSYTVTIFSATLTFDFNETLFQFFSATTPTSISINLSQDSEGNNFGFAPRTETILNANCPGSGKTIGFWKHQLQVALSGKAKAQVSTVLMQTFLDDIEALFLTQPFQFNDANEFKAAFDILQKSSSVAVDLLSKQLLGAEFNEVAGLGFSDNCEALQPVLLAWGEYLVAHSTEFTRAQLLTAKDVFEAINQSGGD